MRSRSSDERPIDYASAQPRSSGGRASVGDVFVAATAFGIAHWLAEYQTGQALRNWEPAVRFFDTRAWLRMSNSSFVSDMVFETMYAVWAAVVFLIVGMIARPPDCPNRRPYGWLTAAVLGVGFCWTRWIIGGSAKRWQFAYPEEMDFAVASCLAVGCSALMMSWWRPRGA